MRGTASSREPIIVEEKPPEGAVVVGRTPQGKLIYQMEIIRGKNHPRLDDAGKPMYAKHPNTVEPLYMKRRLEAVTKVHTFIIEQDRAGNAYKVDYRLPTPEEAARVEREQKIAALGGGAFAEAMVNAGLEPKDVVAAAVELKSRAQPVATAPTAEIEASTAEGEGSADAENQSAETTAGNIAPSEYPHMYAPGRWKLSNGDKLQGRRVDAEAAEAALHP